MTKKSKRIKVFCSWCGKSNLTSKAMLALNKHDLYMCWSCLERAYQAVLVFRWKG